MKVDQEAVAAACGAAIHFAMLPENEAAFGAYLNSSPLTEGRSPVPVRVIRRMMSEVHDEIAPDCDVPIEAM